MVRGGVEVDNTVAVVVMGETLDRGKMFKGEEVRGRTEEAVADVVWGFRWRWGWVFVRPCRGCCPSIGELVMVCACC